MAADPPQAAPIRRKQVCPLQLTFGAFDKLSSFIKGCPRSLAQVVTAFVQRPSDGSVLVVLRSDKVRHHGCAELGWCGRCEMLPTSDKLTPPRPSPCSKQVGTYKRYWGAVSGGIEGDAESPVYRCTQEVRHVAPRSATLARTACTAATRCVHLPADLGGGRADG